jgi:hypothetical protein
LSPAAETEIVDWIRLLVSRKMPPLPELVRLKAKEVAGRYGVDPAIVGGDKWFELFMGRHPELASLLPQQVEHVRVTATNTPALKLFYDNLETVFPLHPPPAGMMRLCVNPESVWNMDECAIMMRNARKKVRGTAVSCQQGDPVRWPADFTLSSPLTRPFRGCRSWD